MWPGAGRGVGPEPRRARTPSAPNLGPDAAKGPEGGESGPFA
jgi:hypothetical protein